MLCFSNLLVRKNSATGLSPGVGHFLSQTLHKLSSNKDTSIASGLKVHLLIYIWHSILAWNCCAWLPLHSSCPFGSSHWVKPEQQHECVWSLLRIDLHCPISTPAEVGRNCTKDPEVIWCWVSLKTHLQCPLGILYNCWELQSWGLFPCTDTKSSLMEGFSKPGPMSYVQN